jgi:hypothetical protein
MNNLDILNEEVVAPSFELWGQAYVTVWKAALVKGQGKVEFDPVMHKRMVWAIDLSIIPLTGANARTAERSMIQTSNEWKLTQASIKELGIEPSEVDQKFVKISFKPTGETYVNAAGEEKNKTYIHFEKVYQDEASCLEDALFEDDTQTADVPTEQQGDQDKEVATALLGQMVRTAVKGSKDLVGVLNALRSSLPKSPVVSKHFTLDSAELLAMVQQEMAVAA